MHLDAGHVCQNLYLAAESIVAGCCAIGAFTDEVMNELRGLDGVKRFSTWQRSANTNRRANQGVRQVPIRREFKTSLSSRTKHPLTGH